MTNDDEKKVEREPDGRWKKGSSGNPEGTAPVHLRGRVKLTHWLEKFLAGDDMTHCPPKARDLIRAMVADAIAKPDSEHGPREGCPATRKLLLDRIDGPVEQKRELTIVPHSVELIDRRRKGDPTRNGSAGDADRHA